MTGPRLTIGLLLMVVATPVRAQVSDLTDTIRPLVESSLRENAGIGLEEFSCDAEMPLAAGERFTCTALDEDGDRLRYVLEVDDEGVATIVRASQPATSLPEELLTALSEPCREFLAFFDFGRWDTLFSGLHPALQAELEWDRVRARLQTVRSVLGEMQPVSASWYTATASGRHQLEYLLLTELDGAVARFELTEDADGRWRVISFIVTAAAGSDASAALIADHGRMILGEVLGAPVERVEAPVRELATPGDLVEGTAYLTSGRAFPIVVQQTGHLDDFDASDYFFSLLDAETLVASGVRQQLDDVTGVECEAPVVPDGGEVRCVVRRSGASAMEVVLSRRGAEHRLRSAGSTPP